MRRIQSVERAINLLTAFTREQAERGLGELAAAVRLSKPTAYRLLVTLRDRDLIAVDSETKKYRLGYGVLRLSSAFTAGMAVRERALPYMRRVRDELGETIVLAVRVGDYRVHVEGLESQHPIRRVIQLGERVPLYAGSASKVLLAAMEDTEIRDYLARVPLVKLGPHTITAPDQLWTEIALVRRRGYAEGRDERVLGGNGLAVPVRDRTGAVAAAMFLTAPVERCGTAERSRWLRALRDATDRLSRDLGYEGTGYRVAQRERKRRHA